jgi:hypothetical protein
MNIICGYTVHNIISLHISVSVFKGLRNKHVTNFDTFLWNCLFKSVVSHMRSCREVLVRLCVTWVRDFLVLRCQMRRTVKPAFCCTLCIIYLYVGLIKVWDTCTS